MYRWTPFPFLRITGSFIFGILISRLFSYFEIYIDISAQIGLLGILLLMYLMSWITKFPYEVRGVLLLICLVGSGFLATHFHTQQERKEELSNVMGQADAYIGIIKSYAIQKDKYFVFEVETQVLISDSVVTPCQANIHLYETRGQKALSSFQYGDKIVVTGQPFSIKPPKNPDEFDYFAYMADQNIFFQHFPKDADVQKISSNHGNPVLSAVYRIRNEFENIIKSFVIGEDEQAVALALLIGIKDFLDPEAKQAFAAAGAMHVLAVSGLHVGVIYMLLLWFFKPFKHKFFRQGLVPALSILLLWFYAMLTGFSPSIFRSVTMFSVVIFAQAFGKKSNIYNSLAVSAFILLLTNPTYLFSVGFQLSYLAVVGIVYFYRRIHRLWEPGYWLVNQIWVLVCVSISAQIATAPISIYYFHQFPTYFLFSNLIVIPLAFIIMFLGILLLACSQFPIGPYVGNLLGKFIWVLNQTVDFIFHQKWSVQDWLYLSPSQTFMIYVVMVLLCAFVYYRKIAFLATASFALILISFEGSASIIRQSEKKELVLYSTREDQVLDYIHGLHARFYSLDTIRNWELIRYQVEPHRLSSHLPPVENIDILKSEERLIGDFGCLSIFDGQRFLFVFKKPTLNLAYALETDYLIVANNAFSDIKSAQDYVQFKSLIMDTSNSRKTLESLRKDAKIKGIDIRLLTEKSIVISRN